MKEFLYDLINALVVQVVTNSKLWKYLVSSV